MDEIQAAALDLFDAQGYDAVTIEEVAERAQVSPSTVYRHFGTKEGLLVHDSSDVELAELLGASIDIDALAGWLRNAGAYIESRVDDISRRRMRYIVDEPAVRALAYAEMHQIATVLAAGLVASRGVSQTHAHVWAHAAIFGLLAAYEQWYTDAGDRPLVEYLDEAITLLTLIPLEGAN